MGLPFVKYEALGNDFVLVRAQDLPPGGLSASSAKAICDRHFGVGADGVLVLSEATGLDVRMDIINADGSVPEMCGNGLRCVVAWWLHTRGLCDAGPHEVKVGAVARDYVCVASGEGARANVRVPMGRVRFEPSLVGLASERMIPSGEVLHLEEGGRRWPLHVASTGNPHAVCVVSEETPVEMARQYGPGLSTHEAFGRGINVSWVRVMDRRRVVLSVFERGAGLTLACGTGACATVATLVRLGLVDADTPVSVELPGGKLEITASEDDQAHVTMEGPARRVFTGVWLEDRA